MRANKVDKSWKKSLGLFYLFEVLVMVILGSSLTSTLVDFSVQSLRLNSIQELEKENSLGAECRANLIYIYFH